MIDFLQDTFVTMFDGSPEKALRAVLLVMGVYVLTAAPLVTWVVYGLFQKDHKVSTCMHTIVHNQLDWSWPACSSFLQVKQQLAPETPPVAKETAANADQVMQLIKNRRSVFPKDFTGRLVDRYDSSCSISEIAAHVCVKTMGANAPQSVLAVVGRSGIHVASRQVSLNCYDIGCPRHVTPACDHHLAMLRQAASCLKELQHGQVVAVLQR